MQTYKPGTQMAYAWASIGFTSIYCAFGLRSGFETPEIIGLLALGLTSMFLLSGTVHKMMGCPTRRESIVAYKDRLLSGEYGLANAGGSIGLTIIFLATAIQLGSGKDEFQLAVVEGIRTAIFFFIAAGVWRLSAVGRLLSIATWVISDIWVFKSVVVYGIGSGFVTFLVGAILGWALLSIQDRMDRIIESKTT